MLNSEKVIKGLEICSEHGAWHGLDCEHNEAYKDCPYRGCETGCIVTIAKDAISLLKEQEARVITRKELKQFEGSPCWFESSGTYMGKDGFWIIPAMFRTFSAGMIMSYISVLDGVGDCGELGLPAYNKAWRCWTARPTTEQRQTVKWG